MTINTTTGALRLTKTEQKLLAKAMLLLVKIAKHGEGAMADCADVAADQISVIERALNKVEEPKAA